MQSRRITANPIKPARYRPGKPTAEEHSSSDESASDVSDTEDAKQPATSQPPPKASSFPAKAGKISNSLKDVNLNERQRQAAEDEKARIEREKQKADDEEGFVTEEENGSEESGSGSEEESSEEESSREEESPKRVLMRPTFIRKDKRKDSGAVSAEQNGSGEASREEDEKRRKEDADALIKEQLEKDAAAREAGKKSWDDDEENEGGEINDQDGLDLEGELAAWKLRELKRVKRERETIELAEKEREEIERRRNLTREEREKEDQEFINKQKEGQEGRGKAAYMQRYLHKGAFFQDDMEKEGLRKRDIMGASFVDEVKDREALPQFMQIRDMTKLGRKGRTKYKDLKTEDTGRWGDYKSNSIGKRDTDGIKDERFLPDRVPGPAGATGANASVVRERPRKIEGAPEGPRAMRRDEERPQRDGGDSYRPGRYSDDESDRERRTRRKSRTRSRSWDRSRQKRSRSPYHDTRYSNEKRRRVDV
jgi:microfibrillar-associated protein 1